MAPRRDAAVAQPASDPRERTTSAAAAAAADEQSDFDELNPTLRRLWQYGGLILGLVAIVGVVAPYLSDDWEPNPLYQLPWMLLLVAALILHETRPYQNADTVNWKGTKPPELSQAAGAASAIPADKKVT